MRKVALTLVALAALSSAAVLSPHRAEAMALPAPTGMLEAIQDTRLVEDVARVCRRVCNWRGCWRRCWWVPGPYYRPYRPWRYRYYRRWRRW